MKSWEELNYPTHSLILFPKAVRNFRKSLAL